MANIPKGKPVAIVYYRYDKDAQTAHGHPHVHKGDFFVHNVVVNDPNGLAPGAAVGDVLVRHVGTWPTSESLKICYPTLAESSGDNVDKSYHRSKAVSGTIDATERLWVCIDIIAYSSANPPPPSDRRPVAYMLDNNTKEPNNALFRGLELLSNGELAIHYWHAVNKTTGATDGRTAKDPKAFEVHEGTNAGKTELAVKYE